MNNLKFLLLRLGAGVVLACAPFLARAVVLGELTSESHLGEPFRARIPFAAERADEKLSPGCLSLHRPTLPLPGTESLPILRKARIRVEDNQILISSLLPVHDPAIRLALDIACSPTGWQRREYTVLLDPQASEHSTLPGQEAQVGEHGHATGGFSFRLEQGDTLAAISRKIYPQDRAMQRSLIAQLRNTNPQLMPLGDNQPIDAAASIRFPDLRSIPYHAPAQSRPQPPVPLPAPLAADASVNMASSHDEYGNNHGYRLKLSSADLDLSQSARITEQERQALRDRLAIMDSDDLMADYLSLRQRMTQMEAQVAEIRLKLAGTLTAPQPPARPSLPTAQESPPQAWQAPLTQPWLWTGAIGLGAVLVLSGLLVRRLRRHREDDVNAELQNAFGFTSRQPTTPDLEEAAKSLVDDESTVLMEDDSSDMDRDGLYDPHSIFAPADRGIALNEADSVIDEVNLYLAYGWHNKAIDLLKLQIEKDPKEAQAWLMLFQIYRREAMKEEYAQLARRFREVFDDPVLWHTVQKIGREFDADNPVYAESDG